MRSNTPDSHQTSWGDSLRCSGHAMALAWTPQSHTQRACCIRHGPDRRKGIARVPWCNANAARTEDRGSAEHAGGEQRRFLAGRRDLRHPSQQAGSGVVRTSGSGARCWHRDATPAPRQRAPAAGGPPARGSPGAAATPAPHGGTAPVPDRPPLRHPGGRAQASQRLGARETARWSCFRCALWSCRSS